MRLSIVSFPQSQLRALFPGQSSVHRLSPCMYHRVPFHPALTQIRHESSRPHPYAESPFFSWLSNLEPTKFTQHTLVDIHDFTGFPWWATVVVTTIGLRACLTLPLAVYQSIILAKVENLRMLEMPEVKEEVRRDIARKAKEKGWTDKQTYLNFRWAMKKRWDALVIRDNCHPFKATVTLWVQIPMWVFLSSALRNMTYMLPLGDKTAYSVYSQLAADHFLWISDLTRPDGLWILPVLLGITNLAIIEMQVLRRIGDASTLQKYVTNFFRIFSVALIPISATVPSVLCLYWTTSSLVGLGQNFLLLSNKFRRVCRIPDTPSTFDHPYLQLFSDLKDKGKTVTKLLRR